MTDFAIAERVLQSVLDAQPVDVVDIKAALKGLQVQAASRPPRAEATNLAVIVSAAAEVLRANHAWHSAFDSDDLADVETEYQRLQDALERLAVELEDL